MIRERINLVILSLSSENSVAGHGEGFDEMICASPLSNNFIYA